MRKKVASIAVRLEQEDFDFLRAVARRLELPTDGRPILGRAVQALIRFIRTSVHAEAWAGQGKLCLPEAAR